MPLFGEKGEMVTEKIKQYDAELDRYADGGRVNFDEGSPGKKGGNYNPSGKNQFKPPSKKEVIDILNDPKYSDYSKSDFYKEKIIGKKTLDKYEKLYPDEIKYPRYGKKKNKPENLENQKRTKKIKKVQGSNISLLGQGQKGTQFSHVYPLVESAPPGSKTTFAIDGSMNRKLVGYNRVGQAIAEQQELLIKNKPDGYKKQIEILNAKAKKNVMDAVQDLGKDYKGQIGYFQVDPETGNFKPKAGNYKMSFAGIKGDDKIYKDMSGTERKAFEKKISKLAKFGKFAKPIGKVALRAVSPFVPILGTAGMVMGGADVAKAADQGMRNEELGIAYLAGPEVAQSYKDLKSRVKGKADETETYVP